MNRRIMIKAITDFDWLKNEEQREGMANNIQSVVIRTGFVPPSAFEGFKVLSSVYLDVCVKEVGMNAFKDCPKLSCFYSKSSVKIHPSAFSKTTENP